MNSFSFFSIFISLIDFKPLFFDNKIIHLSPVQSNNFEVIFFIKFLSRFSLNEISILLFLKLTKFILFSNSYFNPISFLFVQIEINSEKEFIVVLLDFFSSSIECFSFFWEENLI